MRLLTDVSPAWRRVFSVRACKLWVSNMLRLSNCVNALGKYRPTKKNPIANGLQRTVARLSMVFFPPFSITVTSKPALSSSSSISLFKVFFLHRPHGQRSSRNGEAFLFREHFRHTLWCVFPAVNKCGPNPARRLICFLYLANLTALDHFRSRARRLDTTFVHDCSHARLKWGIQTFQLGSSCGFSLMMRCVGGFFLERS